MSEIKPIETEYNGTLFRSRLEARWSVFFDAAGEKYEYEPDGFMIDGMGYVPDFYLPNHDLYVEVKPFRNGAFAEISKTLGMIGTGRIRSLLILSSLPEGTNAAFGYPVLFKHPTTREIVVEWFYLRKGLCGIRFVHTGRYKMIDEYLCMEEELFAPRVLPHDGMLRDVDLHECITKAKAHRFD